MHHQHRLLVVWCMVLDTFHTSSTTYMLWDFSVDNFGKLDIYTHLPWTYSSTAIFSKSASFFPTDARTNVMIDSCKFLIPSHQW